MKLSENDNIKLKAKVSKKLSFFLEDKQDNQNNHNNQDNQDNLNLSNKIYLNTDTKTDTVTTNIKSKYFNSTENNNNNNISEADEDNYIDNPEHKNVNMIPYIPLQLSQKRNNRTASRKGINILNIILTLIKISYIIISYI